jgi:hypothetical protein
MEKANFFSANLKLYYTTNMSEKSLFFGVLDNFSLNLSYELSKNWQYKAKIVLIDYITVIMLINLNI